jgi:uncharacterized protein (TIGR03067 family)
MRFLASTTIVLLLCNVGSVAMSDDSKKDQDKIQGTWEVVEFIANGTTVPQEVRTKLHVVIKGDKIQLTGFGGGIDKREYVFKLDPTKKPKAIDAIMQFDPYKGKTLPGIYDLDGDNLKLCMPNGSTTERPTEFKKAVEKCGSVHNLEDCHELDRLFTSTPGQGVSHAATLSERSERQPMGTGNEPLSGGGDRPTS